jgi:hypothetical protein
MTKVDHLIKKLHRVVEDITAKLDVEEVGILLTISDASPELYKAFFKHPDFIVIGDLSTEYDSPDGQVSITVYQKE